MKAITVWQPWASWIAWGWKTIEVRHHERFRSLVGERIAIHAAKRWDESWDILAGSLLDDQQKDYMALVVRLPLGAVVATATVEDLRLVDRDDEPAALCPCGGVIDLFGLALGDVVALDEPIPATGRQGIWNWTPPDGFDLATSH